MPGIGASHEWAYDLRQGQSQSLSTSYQLRSIDIQVTTVSDELFELTLSGIRAKLSEHVDVNVVRHINKSVLSGIRSL